MNNFLVKSLEYFFTEFLDDIKKQKNSFWKKIKMICLIFYRCK